jgi:hypothetical protein
MWKKLLCLFNGGEKCEERNPKALDPSQLSIDKNQILVYKPDNCFARALLFVGTPTREVLVQLATDEVLWVAINDLEGP